MNRKYCTVHNCFNSNVKTPEKLFFCIPINPIIRKTWLTAIRREGAIGPKSIAFCCEDHFDTHLLKDSSEVIEHCTEVFHGLSHDNYIIGKSKMDKDMDNYVKHNLVGERLKLKKDIVPHKLACLSRIVEKPKRPVIAKRKLAKLKTKPAKLTDNLTEHVASTSHDIEQLYIVEPIAVPVENININQLEDTVKDTTTKGTKSTKKLKKNQMNIKTKVSHKVTEIDRKNFSLSSKDEEQKNETHFEENIILSMESFSDYDIQGTALTDTESECEKDSFNSHMQKTALLCISREPQLLLGLPKKWYCCIQLLSESCECSPRDVMVVLKKIQLNQSNALLALDFGIANSSVGLIFRTKLPLIASCMKSLVLFPKPTQFVGSLPMAFRKRYSNVKSIIECLEIQIEKPSNALRQALTWSEYKSCNTIKYLISITPDGLINFISEGYGGRALDSVIFEDCGVLDLLPKNAAVMADRSFKNVSNLLQQKKCYLIRPPSVSAKVTPTKSEVMETKKIAALRIHVERIIGRLRNFGFLTAHTIVDLKQIDLLDCVMVTACGIVNLQN